jgi:hypothetical protein
VFFGSSVLSVRAASAHAPHAPPVPESLALLAYTVVHFAVWIGLGVLAVAAVRKARTLPAVLMFCILVFSLLALAVVVVAAVLAQGRLGSLAWRDVLLGDLAGFLVATAYIVRHHPELRGELARIADPDQG